MSKPINSPTARMILAGVLSTLAFVAILLALGFYFVADPASDQQHTDVLRSILLVFLPLTIVTIALLMLYIHRRIVLPMATSANEGAQDTVDAQPEDTSAEDEPGVLHQEFEQMALDLEQQQKTIDEAKQRIEHQALHDGLTALPNRSYLQRQIPQYLAASKRHKRRSALLLMDLDQFKSINVSLGHDAADELLVIIAQRLLHVIRQEDFVARVSGDEFVIVLAEISSDIEQALYQIDRVIETLLKNISRPVNIDNTEVQVTASIGIVFFPEHEDRFEKIMKNADSAMYQAKEEGGNRGRFFDEMMQTLLTNKSSVLRTLKEAIASDQLRVYYQPQVDDEGGFIGAEALVRWMHPERGLILPQEFIKAIENNSLIINLGQWVLETVCDQFQRLCERYAGGTRFSLSVNICSIQFQQVDFVEQVVATLERFDFPPQCLVLEITEGVLLRNTQDTRDKIEQIKQHGIRVSIDDFGTGYSSLAYLKNLELDEIKMDASFVRDLFESERDQDLVCAIIAMSQSLNMNLVAEGVETEAQFDFLKAHACPVYQGIHFQEPMPLARFENYLGTV